MLILHVLCCPIKISVLLNHLCVWNRISRHNIFIFIIRLSVRLFQKGVCLKHLRLFCVVLFKISVLVVLCVCLNLVSGRLHSTLFHSFVFHRIYGTQYNRPSPCAALIFGKTIYCCLVAALQYLWYKSHRPKMTVGTESFTYYVTFIYVNKLLAYTKL